MKGHLPPPFVRRIERQYNRPDAGSKYDVERIDAAATGDEAPELPRSLVEMPELDRWIRVNEDETVTLSTGKIEHGPGNR